MRIYTFIACLCSFGIYQLYALTPDQIKAIDDEVQKIQQTIDTANQLKTGLSTVLQNTRNQAGQIPIYSRAKDINKKGYATTMQTIKDQQDKLLNAVKNTPGLPSSIPDSVKNVESTYNTFMTKVDDLFDSIGRLWESGTKNAATIKDDLNTVVSTTLPAIIQKGNDAIAKLEDIKQKAASQPAQPTK